MAPAWILNLKQLNGAIGSCASAKIVFAYYSLMISKQSLNIRHFCLNAFTQTNLCTEYGAISNVNLI